MSKKIPIILLEDVKGLGKTGDIVNVSEGHARNALFPSGVAALADSNEGKKTQSKKAEAEAKEVQKTDQARALAEKLDGTELEIKARTQDESGGTLFGSIKAKEIASELSSQLDTSITTKQINLPEPIKETGEYDITVALENDIEFNFHLIVSPQDNGQES